MHVWGTCQAACLSSDQLPSALIPQAAAMCILVTCLPPRGQEGDTLTWALLAGLCHLCRQIQDLIFKSLSKRRTCSQVPQLPAPKEGAGLENGQSRPSKSPRAGLPFALRGMLNPGYKDA